MDVDCDNEAANLDWQQLRDILGIQKEAHAIASVDVEGKELPSVNHWNNFYYTYAKLTGFSVRKENVRRDKDNNEWQRHWVCSREGFRREKWLNLIGRKKEPKSVTRCGCMAELKVTRNKTTSLWTATSLNTNHNHDLASPSEIQFLRSNRAVPEAVMVKAKSMRRAGIKTSNILQHFAEECGERGKLGFQKTDLYNRLAIDRRAIGEETDCEGALGYLTCLAIRDGDFFCRFNVDEENRLDTIFWADGISRRDYSIFGEILAFDTTYRTNAYNKPLLIMVGVNHHWRTTVFGVALLADETASTFTWILEQFLECMNNKHPKVVVTDGDHAMRTAIMQIFPHSIHRLCAWHLGTNAGKNVPIADFKTQFSKLMYNYYKETEFEDMWRNLVASFNLQESAWAALMYAKKKSWAETFLRGNFFAGMRTTQRCESINTKMQRFLDSKHLMRDFVCQIDAAIQDIRHTEMEDDFKSKHTAPQIPHNDPLYRYYEQVSSTFTRNIYDLFVEEICNNNAYSVLSSEYNNDCHTFKLSRFGFGEVRHHVQYFPAQDSLSCSCLLFETDGIPCRHIFVVMKHLSILRIPDSLMMSRWRKDIKGAFNQNVGPSRSIPTHLLQGTRFGTLASEFNTMGFYACKYEDTFTEAKQELTKLTDKFKGLCTQRQESTSPQFHRFDADLAANNNIIKDPLKVKTKGREKYIQKSTNPVDANKSLGNKKRCRNCNELGHNKSTCKKKTANHEGQQSTPNINFDQSSFPTTGSQHSGSTIRLINLTSQSRSQEYFTDISGHNNNLIYPTDNIYHGVGASHFNIDFTTPYTGSQTDQTPNYN